MTPETLAQAVGFTLPTARLWIEPLEKAMARFDITTPRRQAQFLAQAAHESIGFKRLVENLNYDAQGLASTWPGRFSNGTGPNELARKIARQPERIAAAAYGGRMGNNFTTDGWTYRGRGLFQLTGRANYEAAAKALGAPFVEQPDRVADRDMAALTAAWFWSKNGLSKLADAAGTYTVNGETSPAELQKIKSAVRAVTSKINGGLNGLDDRQARYARAAQALGA